MRRYLKTGSVMALAALASFSSVGHPARAAATGPTQYAIETCGNNQWQDDGYPSYNACAKEAWDEYCASAPTDPGDPLLIQQQCSAGNPFG